MNLARGRARAAIAAIPSPALLVLFALLAPAALAWTDERADREQPDRLVVDLRHNSGGNSLVITPLFAGFGSHRSLRARGHLFAVIGPQTFSSGMMNAVQLKDGFGAILVGVPTGGRPNSYGEVKTLELPNSKIREGEKP